MKEYSSDLTKSVTSGLSRITEPRNQQGLSRCLGLRPRSGFLVRGDTPFNPLGQLSVSWPYPQIFYGMEETIVATATTIYSVDKDISWDLTTLASSITQGKGWHFADFGDFWVMFNGVDFVFRDRSGATVYSSPIINAGCTHNGRLFTGGFKSSFWSSAWRSELNSWLAKEPTGLTGSYEMHKNTVMWGLPGGGDFQCWITDPTSTAFPIVGPYGVGGGYDSDRPFYQDLLRQRTIGWTPMSWSGEVLAIRGLGKNIVVYGSNGVSVLTPLDAGYGEKVLTTEVGIIGRLAVCGDMQEQIGHLFIGTDNGVYKISPDLQFQRMGYEHHLGDLDKGTVVSYDKRWEEFYFSNPKRSFVLSPDGMGESHRPVTGLSRINGKLIGPSMAGTETRDIIDIETETFRMGSGSFKKLTYGTYGLNKIENVRSQLRFKREEDKSFRQQEEKRVNNSGSAYHGVTSTDFRLRLTGDSIDDSAAVTDFRVRWQVSDNRDVRGLYDTT